VDNLNSYSLTILAWGNLSRGDDAAGPLLAEKIQDLNHDQLLLVEDLQLNIEHIMDLHPQIPVLFIDASCKVEQGFLLEKLSSKADNSISTHSVSPTALLHLFEKTMGETAPQAYMLHISGNEFELDQPVSEHTQSAINLAWEYLSELFSMPEQQWLSFLKMTAQQHQKLL